MRVGSLFSGIGGIELGLERVEGFRTAWFVEWNPFCQEVLKKNWPGLPVYGDITTIAWETVTPIDILTGGFPCQPHSQAGKRRASKDERDLWPECRRAISALKPKVCLFENVPGLLKSENGTFFKNVIDDFYYLGYTPRVYRLSARSVGARHLRKRIFIVAYANRDRTLEQGRDNLHEERNTEKEIQEWKDKQSRIDGTSDLARSISDTHAKRLRQLQPLQGLSATWTTEPDMGRVAHGVPCGVDRIKSLGNAVVPQCAEVIGKIIKAEVENQ